MLRRGLSLSRTLPSPAYELGIRTRPSAIALHPTGLDPRPGPWHPNLGNDVELGTKGWDRAGYRKASELMGKPATDAAGKPTTVGAVRADAAWKATTEAQTGAHADGAVNLGRRTNAELPGAVKSAAATLSFGNKADGAYHAHKHAGELPVKPPTATEMVTYLNAARDFIRAHDGVLRHNQNGSRSIVVEANGMRAIVSVAADGGAVISTFGKASS